MKFIIPSLIGILFFIVPIPSGDGFTIPVAFLSNWLIDLIGDIVPTLAVIMMGISVVGSLITYAVKPAFILERPHMSTLFNVTPFWFVMRVIGFIAGVMTLLVIGPEAITSEFTGGLLLYDLIPILFATFLFAGILLPLLLNFGLLEFVGTMLIKVMRPLFRLPGRASLDALASWVGDATIGILLTTRQYEEGYYTKREASIIATTFSVVSITFTIVILSYMELDAYFPHYYGTIILSGIVAALIMPRIYPLSRKPDTAYEKTELKPEEPVPANVPMRVWALRQALLKSKSSKGAGATFKDGFQNVIDMWLGILPVVMAVGTIALVIAEHTSLFTILGKPFEPILMLLQVPEAEAAAQNDGRRVRRHVLAGRTRQRHRERIDTVRHRLCVRHPAHLHVGSRRIVARLKITDLVLRSRPYLLVADNHHVTDYRRNRPSHLLTTPRPFSHSRGRALFV